MRQKLGITKSYVATSLLSVRSKSRIIRNASAQRDLEKENLAIREPYSILQSWLLAAERQAPHSKPRVACVATVDCVGQPITRLTNIEQINPSGITFYSALGSRQAGEISTNPHVSLRFHWPEVERSVHIVGIASPVCKLQAQRQFWQYSRQVQLSLLGVPQAKATSMAMAIYARIKQAIKALIDRQEEPLPVPNHWGGFLLKPSLYEFFDGSRGSQDTQYMRFRRCLSLPRGMRKCTLNAQCYDWVFDNGRGHDYYETTLKI